MDMLKELSTMFGFTFTIHDNPDGKYGQNNGGTWNGMIGEVIRGTADIALADMTITSKREEAVDFTHPFLNIGLGVLGYRGAAPSSLQELRGPSLPEDLGKDAGGPREHDDQLERGRRGQGACQPGHLCLYHGVRLNRLSGCSQLPAHPGWQDLLATQLWPRFGTRFPLQKGAEQGHPDDAGVRQDGDAGQEVDRTPGFRVRRSAGRTYGMAFQHALVSYCCSVYMYSLEKE